MAIRVSEVAGAAGVSPGTVSNVLNHPDKVSPEVRARVNAAIEQLGFTRNGAARQLRIGKSPTIGLVALDLHPFFIDLARGAVETAEKHGLSVLVANTDDNLARETAYLDLFEQQRVHGVLISPSGEFAARVERFRQSGIPVVLVDRFGAGNFSSVSVDDVAGGRLAAEHLVSIGRRRLWFVGGPISIRQVSDRLRGASGVTASVPDASIELVEAGLTMHAGREAGKQYLARPDHARPDGVFTATDLVAIGFLQELALAGVRVPEDVAVVGYDGADFASAAIVPLTTVQQPGEEVGRAATEMLIEIAANPESEVRNIVYQPELLVRASTVRQIELFRQNSAGLPSSQKATSAGRVVHPDVQ